MNGRQPETNRLEFAASTLLMSAWFCAPWNSPASVSSRSRAFAASFCVWSGQILSMILPPTSRTAVTGSSATRYLLSNQADDADHDANEKSAGDESHPEDQAKERHLIHRRIRLMKFCIVRVS